MGRFYRIDYKKIWRGYIFWRSKICIFIANVQNICSLIGWEEYSTQPAIKCSKLTIQTQGVKYVQS